MHTGLRVTALAVAVALALPAAAQTASFDPAAIYARAAPAVAVVRTVHDGRTGVGTAFAISPDGHLLTAAHVARRADRITVTSPGGRPQAARLVGYDARRDLAVLGVEADRPVPHLRVSDEHVRVGDPVAVIGTPRGRPGVMTVGEVLDTDTTLPGLVPGILVRFSAPVAPGSSGGPVLNARAEAIGVVVAASTRPGATGGLAVSGPTISASLPSLLEGARTERAWIGIVGTSVTPELAAERGLPVTRGVLVVEVVPGSPAFRAGLRGGADNGAGGDVLTALDEAPLGGMEDLLRAVGERVPGQRVRLRVIRGERVLNVELVLGIRP